MKITKRDLGVIMILAGILIAFLTYRMSFSSTMEDVEAIQKEQQSLRQQIKDLEPIKAQKDFYEAEMARYEKEIQSIIEEFPVNIIYEDGLMYVVDIKDELDVEISTLIVEPATVISSVAGLDNNTYKLMRASESMTYKAADYDTLKKLLNYIYLTGENEDIKNIITSVGMVFDEKEGAISGTLNICMYVMDDGSRVYVPADIPEEFFDEEHIGVDVVFGETKEAEEETEAR